VSSIRIDGTIKIGPESLADDLREGHVLRPSLSHALLEECELNSDVHVVAYCGIILGHAISVTRNTDAVKSHNELLLRIVELHNK
jgi:hypothetical protein